MKKTNENNPKSPKISQRIRRRPRQNKEGIIPTGVLFQQLGLIAGSPVMSFGDEGVVIFVQDKIVRVWFQNELSGQVPVGGRDMIEMLAHKLSRVRPVVCHHGAM